MEGWSYSAEFGSTQFNAHAHGYTPPTQPRSLEKKHTNKPSNKQTESFGRNPKGMLRLWRLCLDWEMIPGLDSDGSKAESLWSVSLAHVTGNFRHSGRVPTKQLQTTTPHWRKGGFLGLISSSNMLWCDFVRRLLSNKFYITGFYCSGG